MRRTRLVSALSACAVTAGAVAVVPMMARSSASDYRLPDLVSVAPPTDTAYLIEGAFASNAGEENAANRLLLRFDGYIDNVGDGPLHFEGNPQTRGVRQWAQRVTGGAPQPLMAGDAIASPGAYPLNNDAESRPECVGVSAAPPARPAAGPCFIYSSTDSVAASDGHDHWHLVGAARYSLWNEAGDAQVAPGQKAGFCLYDYARIPGMPSGEQFYGYKGGTDNFCQSAADGGGPRVTSLVEGINPGFRDVYESRLAWQWIDVSDVPPGRYRLGNEADPYNRVWEKNEVNPVAKSPQTVAIPGWVSPPPAPASTAFGSPVAVALSASKVTGICKKDPNSSRYAPCASTGTSYTPADADRRFRVVQAPRYGTLSVAPGADFTSPSLVYTPNPGVQGVADSFQYTVRDAASAYPLHPSPVTAVVTVSPAAPAPAPGPTPGPGPGAPGGTTASVKAVSIDGAPGTVLAGMQARLRANLVNASGPVVWSVNGRRGGSRLVGTISSTGVYRAPALPPASPRVVIGVALASDPSVVARTTVRIGMPVRSRPIPLPFASMVKRGNVTLSLARMGDRVVVQAVPKRSGVMSVRIHRGAKRVKACTFRRAVAGRLVLCSVRAPKPKALRNAKVTVITKARGAKRAQSAVVTRRVI